MRLPFIARLFLTGVGVSVAACAVQAPQRQSAPGALDVATRLHSSTRHAEWAMIPVAPGSADSVAAYVVYPERRGKAPVVVVVHEIFGLSGWVRGGATTDFLAIRALTRTAWVSRPDRIVLKEIDSYMRGRERGELPEILRGALLAAGASTTLLDPVLDERERAIQLVQNWT